MGEKLIISMGWNETHSLYYDQFTALGQGRNYNDIVREH